MEASNNAKLREALELARLYISLGPEAESRAYVKNGQIEMLHAIDVIDKVSTALAAPPRNCDALSAQEQTEKFNQFCQSHRNSDLPKCAGCPLEDIPDGTGCAQAWAQLPCESEVTDGEARKALKEID